MPTPSIGCGRCPGIGKILALTILYEIHDITRFDRVQEFASYARLVKCPHESGRQEARHAAGRRWATSISSGRSPRRRSLFLRHTRDGKTARSRRLEKQHGKGKALSILAHKIGRAVYYMLVARHGVLDGEVPRGVAG